MTAARWRRAVLVTLGLALLLGGVATVNALSATAKADLSLQIAPASQTVTRTQSATYTVSVTPVGGLTGSVSFAASGLPSAATATFNPASLTISGTSSQTSTLTIATTSTTPIGSVTFTVTGTSGKVSSSVTAGLTVNYQLSGSLSMTSNPTSSTISPGATAVYSLALVRTNMGTNAVSLSVVNRLPTGTTASFSPASTSSTTSSLSLVTTSAVATGTYTVYLAASGKDVNGTTQYAYTNVSLVVSTSGKPFTISSGAISSLSPGVSRPIDLTIVNSNNSALAVSNLTVTAQSVSKATGITATCTTADYAVTQYTGPYPLSVPKNGTASLSGLAVPQAQWPQVRMLDTAKNQDGCKGASISLTYTGSGSGS